ncbi:QueT transporter family protein [Clostridium thailandense]|uniref:QueT transporter family protein n=1 Tax=Clostridium thailandense TaxID=2794346 RepID=A0A949TZP1_9CLOT|nr:QueT transporter family protein [Clostridium thailandense]MBV7273539.1 QueT transporter family protein [Clostridium thailandense]
MEVNVTKNKNISSVKKLAISGLVIGMYVIVMYFTQSFAFGQYQIRIATSLYALSGIFPFLILPMGVANLISNTIMGGLGVFDMLGGAAVGMMASGLVYLIKRLKLNDWFAILPIIFIPGLVVPIWLSILIHVPYKVLAISLCVGQIIPAIVGVLLLKQLRKVL